MADQAKKEEKPKTGGLFHKLRGLVYEEETATETAEVSETSEIPVNTNNSTPAPSRFNYTSVSPAANQNIPANFVMPTANGVFDQNFYNNFLQIIETNNIEGVDYFEFSKAKKAMDANPGMAESLKYQAAFGSLQATSNLTKARLLETADFYIGKLDQEEKEFNSEMQNEIESQVNSRLAQAKEKQDRILQLQAEMNTLQTEIGTLNSDAQQSQIKIESTAKNFKVSLEVLKGQINLDKQNINNFIQ